MSQKPASMASIDALAKGLPAPVQGLSSKPDFELEDKEFTTVKSIKAVATLDEAYFNDLCDDVRDYVAENLSVFEETPRSIKSANYRKLLDDFTEKLGNGYWIAGRRDYNPATHFAWPADKEKWVSIPSGIRLRIASVLTTAAGSTSCALL